jgi:hypothetical protein
VPRLRLLASYTLVGGRGLGVLGRGEAKRRLVDETTCGVSRARVDQHHDRLNGGNTAGDSLRLAVFEGARCGFHQPSSIAKRERTRLRQAGIAWISSGPLADGEKRYGASVRGRQSALINQVMVIFVVAVATGRSGFPTALPRGLTSRGRVASQLPARGARELALISTGQSA